MIKCKFQKYSHSPAIKVLVSWHDGWRYAGDFDGDIFVASPTSFIYNQTKHEEIRQQYQLYLITQRLIA